MKPKKIYDYQQEREKDVENLAEENERLIHELIEVLDDDICPLPIPTPEQIRARNKAFKKISDEHLKKI